MAAVDIEQSTVEAKLIYITTVLKEEYDKNIVVGYSYLAHCYIICCTTTGLQSGVPLCDPTKASRKNPDANNRA